MNKKSSTIEVTSLNQSSQLREGGLRTRGCFKSDVASHPLVSVVTVARNAEIYIENAIQSVLQQSYDNVEYIVVDGNSSDGTCEIIQKYDDVIDYWVSEDDNGVYDAMNKGARLSKGAYVLFLGCDDKLLDVLHEVVPYLDRSATSYYGDVILSKDGSVYDGRFYPLKLFIRNIPHQAIFYSRKVFDKYLYNCSYITVADYDLNLRLFSHKGYGLKYIPKVIAEYNNEHGLSSTSVDYEFSKDKPNIIRKHYSMFNYLLYMLLRYVYKAVKTIY